MTVDELRTAFATLPLELPDACLAELLRAYSEPSRHYHSIDHVLDLSGHYAAVERDLGWTRPREVFLALAYHDAVYRPGDPANESASAMLARSAVARFFRDLELDPDRVADLIELTALHGKLGDRVLDTDAALFLDCDMAILGAPAATYAAYASGVRAELVAVFPEALYRAGRQRFLEQLLEANRIFSTDYFERRFELDARRNLRWELDRLAASDRDTASGSR